MHCHKPIVVCRFKPQPQENIFSYTMLVFFQFTLGNELYPIIPIYQMGINETLVNALYPSMPRVLYYPVYTTGYNVGGVSKTRNETKRNGTKRNSPIPVANISGRGVGVYGAVIDSSFIYSLPLERAGNCITGMLDS